MLIERLSSFRETVNGNHQVKKLLAGWEPNIIIETSDTAESYSLLIRDKAVAGVLEGKQEQKHQIVVEGDEDILDQVFSGSLNPAEAVLDGQIAVYGNDKDQLKLDALCLVIWGM
ncbi:hypothetical protein V9K67_24655 [Paraflavisolibacter sp. H34]|uniref:hypothetical protein n=1 Tax=Huijunlia imazamoxiresistens TaxID=3127457 RepID=UPI0030189892